MRKIINEVRQFIVKDLLIATLIVGTLILTGSPFIDARGMNSVLFFIVVFALWKFKKTSLFLLSITRISQMINLVGPIAGLLLAIGMLNSPILQSPYVSKLFTVWIFGYILQGSMYFYLCVWSKLLKEGKDVDISVYKKPIIIISIAIGIFIFFGEDVVKWYFAN